MTPFEEYLARAMRRAQADGKTLDTSCLDKRFIPYYNTGQRIKVDFGHGEVRCGTVGITTGWRPTFLLMLRANSLGSTWTLGFNDRIIANQRGRRYYPINERPYGRPDPLTIATRATQTISPYYEKLASMDIEYRVHPDGYTTVQLLHSVTVS